MDYVTVDQLKAHVTATTVDETEMGLVITAASRAIDAMCGRRFGQAPAPTARLFSWNGETVDGVPAVLIDDVSTTTGLVVTVDTTLDYTYATTITLNTDFDLYPWNAAGDLEPWTAFAMRCTSSVSLPKRARAISVTAQWGWADVPSLVEVACLIQAARWYMRKTSWAGVAGSPDLGSEIRLLKELDPDVQAALQPLVRYWGAV